MKTTPYRIVELKSFPVASLTPHPDAKMPIAEDDAKCLEDSINEKGVIQPPLVLADGRIVDGINRVNSARAAGIEELLCLVIECSDVHSVAAMCLAVGRKRTTGQRIMVYLEAHKAKVLEAYQQNSSKGDGFRSSILSRDRMDKGTDDFTAEAIAKKLRCSNKDVLSGIALLQAQSAKTLHALRGGKAPDMEKYHESAEKAMLDVLSGSLAIRRWAPAAMGRVTTKEQAKGDPQYKKLARTSAVTLKNCFDAWGTIEWDEPRQDGNSDDQSRAEEAIAAMLQHVPDTMSHMIHEVIVLTWSPAKRAKLLRDLEAKAKAEKDAHR